jgi:hypothetical protein
LQKKEPGIFRDHYREGQPGTFLFLLRIKNRTWLPANRGKTEKQAVL